MLNNLNSRFRYKADAKEWWDTWDFMSPTAPVIEGDCEDYSITTV